MEELMVTVGNSPRSGGGFYLTPDADAELDDGLLDIGIASALTRVETLRLMPAARAGQHTNHPAVHMVKRVISMSRPRMECLSTQMARYCHTRC